MNTPYRIKTLIDTNFVEHVEYEPLALTVLSDEDVKQYDEMFDSYIGVEIQTIIQMQEKFQTLGSYAIPRNKLKEFFEKLFTASCPKILKVNVVLQQVYLLHLMASLLYRYNERVLKMPKDEYIDRIYFTNILTICASHLIQARRFMYRIIKTVFKEVESKSEEVIEFYTQLYHADETIIRNDILHLFLISVLPKFNPLAMDDVEEFYSGIFRRIFFFYLKSKISGLTDKQIDPSIIQDNNMVAPSERYRIYEEALYLAQFQKMCSDSTTIHHISRQFEKIKDIVIPNEIQRLYLFAINHGRFNTGNPKVAILKIQEQLSHIEQLKNKLPYIYRLLRSIHVISDSPAFVQEDLELIRSTVYSTLYEKFQNKITDNEIIPIIRNVADNLVNSLVVGEFIDMVTLTPINLCGPKFSEQLKQFLELIFSGLGNEQLM